MIALAVTSLAPRGHSAFGGAGTLPTTDRSTMRRYMQGATGKSNWNMPDGYVPPTAASRGLPVYIDFRCICADTPSRLDSGISVPAALRQTENLKSTHYKTECSTGGPMAPGRGLFVPFIVEAGGRLGLQAGNLLRCWARLAAGDPDPHDPALPLSRLASAYYTSYMRVVGVTLQRCNAIMVHQAAAWLDDQCRQTEIATAAATHAVAADAPVPDYPSLHTGSFEPTDLSFAFASCG